MQDSGIADSIGGPGFAVTANASGMHVTVQPGFAILRGHAVLSTAVETVPVEAPDPAPRTDRIVLRLDPAQNSIILTVVRGVPNGGAPAVTRTDTGVYELGLALVVVEPGIGSIAADKVTDDRTHVGSRVGAWTSTTRPAGPRVGQLGFNISALSWEFWTTNGWIALAPTVTWNSIEGKPATFVPAEHKHDWSLIQNKPTSFTPASHSHAWSTITGKPDTFAPDQHRHNWNDLDGKPGTFPSDGHGHDYSPSWHGHDYSPSWHSHDAPWTVGRANGSDRVHGNSPAGSGWYAVWCDGNRNFCHNTSSIRYKQNVRDYTTADPYAVLNLRPVVYDRKPTLDEDTGEWQDGQTDEYGLIAEEVHEHLPELVLWMDLDDGNGLQIESLRYDLLAVSLIPLLRAQNVRITELEARLDQLGEDLAPCLDLGEPD